MSENVRKIIYRFNLSNGKKEVVALEFNAETMHLLPKNKEYLPDWARLTHQQCPHCPLTEGESPFCPVASSVVGVVSYFSQVISYDQIHLEVETEERTISQTVSAQQALGSFMGLVMAASGCPHTEFFKPMARYHLPLAKQEETIYRSASMYMLAQYFCAKESGNFTISLDGLEEIYKNIQIVNSCIVKRLQDAGPADSSVNGIVILDMFARVIPYATSSSLEELRYLFEPYLQAIQNQRL